jgi:hypothetical protein
MRKAAHTTSGGVSASRSASMPAFFPLQFACSLSHLALSPIPPHAPAPPPPPASSSAGFVPARTGAGPAGETDTSGIGAHVKGSGHSARAGAGAVAQGGSGRNVLHRNQPPARLGQDQGTIPEPKPARGALGNGARTDAKTEPDTRAPCPRTGPNVAPS